MRRGVVRARQARHMFWTDIQQEKRRMGGVEDSMLVEDTKYVVTLHRVMGASFGVGVRKVVSV